MTARASDPPPDPPADDADDAATRARLVAELEAGAPELVASLRAGGTDFSTLSLDWLQDLVRIETTPARRAALALVRLAWLGLHPSRRS
jgi:hypothetical protein